MPSSIEELIRKKCVSGEGKLNPLTDAESDSLLKGLAGWQRDGKKIAKEYKLKDHYQTQAFTNAVMWVSHREDHHPDLTVGYNTCRVEFWTHTIEGLSENDFICAAKIEMLFDL